MARAYTKTASLPLGFVKARHPDGGGCSHAGVSYEPDADGNVTVPFPALPDLAAHGFVVVGGSDVGEVEPEPTDFVVDEPLAKTKD